MRAHRAVFGLVLLDTLSACSGSESNPSEADAGAPTAGTIGIAGNATAKGGANAKGGATATGATTGAGETGMQAAGSSAGGAPGSGGTGTAGTSSTAGAGAGASTGPVGTISCASGKVPYTISAGALETGGLPAGRGAGSTSELVAELPVSVDPNGRVYVGLTVQNGSSRSAVIASPGRAPILIPDAINGGVAATRDGVAVLLFDPNTSIDQRKWAAVRRLKADGTQIFQTDLFRSTSLDEQGSKGAPSTSRLGYVEASNQLIAYFGHTELYNDGVRHQGGFLGSLDGAGKLSVINKWFGSHNLDQRVLVEGTAPAVLGLGDAYPEGIFLAMLGGTGTTRPTVIYPLAAAGNGAANGQLGGMVDLGTEILVQFITNRSVPQDLDAGSWPNIDQTISAQIRDAAGNGTDLGIFRVPRGAAVPQGGFVATFIDAARPMNARLARLKSARYGMGDLILLAWAELTGTGRSVQTSLYTMVIDPAGMICQPKTPLAAEFLFNSGDDLVRTPNGTILWANSGDGAVRIVTLRPGEAG